MDSAHDEKRWPGCETKARSRRLLPSQSKKLSGLSAIHAKELILYVRAKH